MVHVERGNAFGASAPNPRFLVVSILDTDPPDAMSRSRSRSTGSGSYVWNGGTSLKAFFQLMLDARTNANGASNMRECVASWHRMRDSLPPPPLQRQGTGPAGRYESVQQYYVHHPSPTVVYDGVHLRNPDGSECFAMLVHAPDFTLDRLQDRRGISLLVAAYRAVRTACTLRGGDYRTARMAPLSAGVFQGDHVERILAACANELFHAGVSVPLTVYGYSVVEYEMLLRAFAARGGRIGVPFRIRATPRPASTSAPAPASAALARPTGTGSTRGRPTKGGKPPLKPLPKGAMAL